MGEQFPNRASIRRTWAKACRTRAKARRSRAKVRRTRAGNFRKRRRAIFLGEQWAKYLHPILILIVLRPLVLQASSVYFHMHCFYYVSFDIVL